MATNNRSDVYNSELDLTVTAQIISNTNAAFLGASKEGPAEFTFYTSRDDFIARNGKPDASVSFLHHSVLSYFNRGSGAWVRRVTSADAIYGGMLLQDFDNGSGQRSLSIAQFATNNPDDVDFASAGGANDVEDNILYIQPLGPGSYAGNIVVEILSPNLTIPVLNSAVEAPPAANLTSLLVNNTYTYVITAYNSYGETAGSVSRAAVVANAGDIVRLQWNQVPGAAGYRIYRKTGTTTGTFTMIGTASSAALEYEDYNNNVAKAAVPPTTGTIPILPQFTLNVYDTRISSSTPLESKECSLLPRVNANGVQTEIEYVINNVSKYIKVTSNASNLSTIPTIYTMGKQALTGGTSGSIVTESDMILALNELKDKETYDVNVLVNCGFNTINYQKALVALAEYRKDCIAVLDTPVPDQSAENAVNYRSIEIGINSNRGALMCNDHYTLDPYNNVNLFIPPSGVMAGLLAFTDKITNPSYSPAGVQRGTVLETQSLRYKYDEDEMDAMATAGINYFNVDRSYGTVLKECYTLQTEFSALSFIPVRRILDVAENGTRKALKYFLQQPNTPLLAAQLLQLLRQYYGLMVTGDMIGSFGVSANTTDADIQLGNRRLTSVIVPNIPAVRIFHTTVIAPQGTVNFDTIIQQITG